MKTYRLKSEDQKKSTKVVSKVSGKKTLKKCFVKLGRISVQKEEPPADEMRRGRRSGGPPAEVTPTVGRPRKILASVGLVQKRNDSDGVKTAAKALKNLISSPPLDKKLQKKNAKTITASHDKALLKHTEYVSSKRTPKPNRRYINEDTVTKAKGNFYEESEEEEEDEEQQEDEEQSDKNDSDGVLQPPTDYDSSEEVEDEEILAESPPPKKQRKDTSAAVTQSAPPRPVGRPPKNATALRLAQTASKKDSESSSDGRALKKRKLNDSREVGSPVHKALLRKMHRKSSPATSQNESSDVGDDEHSDNRSSPALRVRKTNAAAKQPAQYASATSNKQNTSSTQLAAKRSALSATLKQKLNTSAPGPQSERSARQQQPTKSVSANCTPLTSPKFYGKKRGATAEQKAASKSPQSPAGDSADLEDFEQMPTFTIVNINDIINQKEDMVVLKKQPKRKPFKRNDEDDDDVDYEPSAGDDDDQSGDEHSTKLVSRRKTQHTTLSDKQKPGLVSKSSPPKILNHRTAAPTRPYSNTNGGVAAAANKGAPRILNSTLCRNTLPTVEPRVLNDSLNNNNRSKENVIKTFNSSRGAAPLQSKTLQPPKTVISHQVVQGGATRRVRKITCFETWFVIKLPAEEQPLHKSVLAMSLLELGNDIKKVALPSDKWSYTISLLQKKGTANRSTGAAAVAALPGELVYTGEVQDTKINPDDRHLYVPTNIMFRRKNQVPSLRMQFDRALILKNNMFYINIEGKNVKLLAAPMALQSLAEIETLLQIVNEVSLVSPLVEQTNYVV